VSGSVYGYALVTRPAAAHAVCAPALICIGLRRRQGSSDEMNGTSGHENSVSSGNGSNGKAAEKPDVKVAGDEESKAAEGEMPVKISEGLTTQGAYTSTHFDMQFCFQKSVSVWCWHWLWCLC
jgi:hypothetical protein